MRRKAYPPGLKSKRSMLSERVKEEKRALPKKPTGDLNQILELRSKPKWHLKCE
jgi:hypothetical protein